MAKEIKKDNNEEVKDVKEEVKEAKKESKPKTTKKANKKDTKKDNKKSFFKEFKAELKRVSWPTFKQLVNNTVAVLAIVILVAVIVFVLDVIFENVNNFGVERLKALVTSDSIELVVDDEESANDAISTIVEGTEVPSEADGTEEATEEPTDATVETEDGATK